jgi:hypothetical protein
LVFTPERSTEENYNNLVKLKNIVLYIFLSLRKKEKGRGVVWVKWVFGFGED